MVRVPHYDPEHGRRVRAVSLSNRSNRHRGRDRFLQAWEAHFDEAMRRKGNARWLHAAQSFFHDIRPALKFNIPVAWINRKSEALPEGQTKLRFVVSDLNQLADHLGM